MCVGVDGGGVGGGYGFGYDGGVEVETRLDKRAEFVVAWQSTGPDDTGHDDYDDDDGVGRRL